MYDALNKTFVTPLDRSDIYSLATDLENITDLINRTMMQIVLHALDEVPPGSTALAAKIHEACAEIDAAVKLLRGIEKLDDPEALQGHREDRAQQGTRSSAPPSPRCSRPRRMRSG